MGKNRTPDSYHFILTGPDIIVKPVMVPTTKPPKAEGRSEITVDGFDDWTRVDAVAFDNSDEGEVPYMEVSVASGIPQDVAAGRITFQVDYVYEPEPGGTIPPAFQIMASFTVV